MKRTLILALAAAAFCLQPAIADGLTAKSYPDGYEISELGPETAGRPD